MGPVTVKWAGEACLFVEFGKEIDLTTNTRVQIFKAALNRSGLPEVVELVPTYCSLAVYVDPLKIRRPGLFAKRIEEIASSIEEGREAQREGVIIPVCYGGECGPDMENVCRHTGLTAEEVICRHSGRNYYCYMLGFTPGFTYLGGMDEALATPRLSNPRTVIPAGSVGIAGRQTGIYPIESPGGWQLIGRTPLRLFDPNRDPPTLIRSGMWVRFRPIAMEDFVKILNLVEEGRYPVESFEMEDSPV